MKSIIFALFCIVAINLLPLSTAVDISHIPFYGNRENFHLPAAHALAYAEAIRSAEFEFGDWEYLNFDMILPVLIDVSGDGIPLLLLAVKFEDYWGTNQYWNILFGYANGEIQRITERMAIGMMHIDGENLLSVGWVTDFGGSYDFYRVQNGAAEFVSTMRFVADWHGGTPHGEISIDSEELSPEEYWEILAATPTKRLMDRDHPGFVTPYSTFEEYLSQSFTSDQLMQIFLDHAASVE
ncbi:MAG: hypothetical protein FWE92_03560 [Defluviitaleaceae bacterium]|nr:hypothetical protein [Defluviitaleaceae bacterium]